MPAHARAWERGYCNPQQMPQFLATQLNSENCGDEPSNLRIQCSSVLAQADHTLLYILVMVTTGCDLCV